MRQIEARNRGGRPHRKVFGDDHAGVFGGVEQFEQRAFFAVLGAGGVAGRGADALIFFGDQVFVSERFLLDIAPVFLAYALVQVLGEGFGEAVAQRFEQDRVVVVVRGFEGFGALVLTDAGGDDERAEVVGAPGILGRDKIGETQVGAAFGFFRLLAQVVPGH